MDKKELVLRKYKLSKQLLSELLWHQNDDNSIQFLDDYIYLCMHEIKLKPNTYNSLSRFHNFLKKRLNDSSRLNISSAIRDVLDYEENLDILEKLFEK